jgi:hypothetical protein
MQCAVGAGHLANLQYRHEGILGWLGYGETVVSIRDSQSLCLGRYVKVLCEMMVRQLKTQNTIDLIEQNQTGGRGGIRAQITIF